DELLESLSEVEASAARDARAMDLEPGGVPDVPTIEATDREIAVRRSRLIQRQKLLGRFIVGPAAASAFILGASGMMLPGSDSFGAAAVAALILFLIMRELTSAHAEESGSMRSKILSHTLLVPISPLLVVFAFIVAVKVLEVL